MNVFVGRFKSLAFWGIFVMLLMLVLTIIFKDLRMYMLDPNWILYLIANEERMPIQEMRIGSFVTHLFPYLGVKIGLGLKTIQFFYNISFFTFFSSVYAIVYYKFKQYDLNILILGYFSLFVGDVFYWPNNEVHQGFIWAMLALAMFYYYHANASLNIYKIIWILVLLFLGITSHLLVAIPIIFIWLYKGLIEANGKIKQMSVSIYWGIIAIGTVIVAKFLLINKGDYEDAKLAPIRHIKFETAFQSFSSSHALDFYNLLFSWHVVAFVSILIGVFILLKFKSKWFLLLYILTILGYWILINLIFPYPMPRRLWFYMESEYQVLSIILLVPLLYFASFTDKRIKLFHGYISIVVIVCFCKIGYGYNFFNARFQNITTLIDYCVAQKITKGALILTEEERKDYFIMDWGLPNETLTYALNQGMTPTTVKIVNDEQYQYLKNEMMKRNVYLGSFEVSKINAFNPKYFYLDTINDYQILNKQVILPLLQKLD